MIDTDDKRVCPKCGLVTIDGNAQAITTSLYGWRLLGYKVILCPGCVTKARLAELASSNNNKQRG